MKYRIMGHDTGIPRPDECYGEFDDLKSATAHRDKLARWMKRIRFTIETVNEDPGKAKRREEA